MSARPTPATPATPASPDARAQLGKAARKRAPRSSHGTWQPAAERTDPLDLLEQQAATRLPDLLPIRYARMSSSPFVFLRGAAAVMAADLAAQPHTRLTVQLCGDAHLLNFGLYASPERALVFDVNDFDETLPGPFEWDVKRLATSIAVAARDNGFTDAEARSAVLASVESYRLTMRRLAGLGELAVWYERVDTQDVLALVGTQDRRRVRTTLARARQRTSLQALDKLTEVEGGRRRFLHDPPLLQPIGAALRAAVGEVFAEYRSTLPEERRVLLDRFHVVDAARKVVGAGSVGIRCFVALLEGRDADDPLFLQIKEAEPSVLERHLGPSPHEHHGRRVVAGQRLMQATSDIFLGWVTGPEGRHYYWRQLRDMKGSADVTTMRPRLLSRYAGLCGRTLARAHARTGDRIAIANYLGRADTFDRAVTAFATRYADQSAADYALLTAAIAAGAIRAAPSP
ncbi:DUF2252 domain-containing protein [Streptomyces monticola]|uniref:DUF2252 domain-containing protein n=1 Tax=Streptomyces monticola TaxID=2666263 RepID=A0ABW2JHF1_9ACTN